MTANIGLPRRLSHAEFFASIRNMELSNPLLPEFDVHVADFQRELGTESAKARTFDDAIDMINAGRRSDEIRVVTPALKKILVGYSYTHSWTIRVKFEKERDGMYLHLKLLESENLTVCSDFRLVQYGALSAIIVGVDRLDTSHRVGPHPKHLPILSEQTARNAVANLRDDPNLAAKKESMERMRSSGDLVGNLRTISRVVRDRVQVRRREFFAGRFQTSAGLIPKIVMYNGPSLTKNNVGAPRKETIAREAFFNVLLHDDFNISMTKAAVIRRMLVVANEFVVADLHKTNIHEDTCDSFLKRNGFWRDYTWHPELWKIAFARWKNAKNIS
ncbi:MAG: hypothetical protein AAF996_14730 [Pseudomonadota bacterium]